MPAAPTAPTVLLTDHAWPDTAIERDIVEAAGFRLHAGPAEPSPPDAIVALVQETQPVAIMTCWARVPAEAIAASPGLRVVARVGVGLDNIDVEEATRRGVWVTNVPDYCVEEVSDHAVGLLLAWARGIVHFAGEVRAGRWNPASARLHRVSDLTVGLLGYGRIARRAAQKLAGFGVRLLAHDLQAPAGDTLAEMVPLDALFARSDVIIVMLPLTPQTHHLVNAERIGTMRQGGCVINVSRGGVVDTQALTDALASGRLGGAGLDVLEQEPDVPPALRERADAIVTPHIAFSSAASLAELRRRASEEVVRVLRGERPQQPCNAPLPAGTNP